MTATTVWDEPGWQYFTEALEDLHLEDADLEDVIGSEGIPVGKYPTFDAVYERAWEFRRAADPPSFR
jgi:hypothetical protein